ncbi:hypothetical protein SDC9_142670 [bioreactor metagenome]|uniref:Beta-galactosidase C-terminal domain-containing protein n=1 Tax=bioreactor metagenome TaxID=1076179 RepID=A0A645E1W1_9ZZZZ
MKPVLPESGNEGVSATLRSDGETDWLFVFNYTKEERNAKLPAGEFLRMADGQKVAGILTLPSFGAEILKKL